MAATTGQSGSRAKRGADTRREILDVARRMFGGKGYDRTSMAEIAAQVGVVEGALYKHFPGKRELLLEATRAYLEPRFEATRAELAGVTGTRNRLRFVVFRHLREFVDDPGICRLVIQEIRASDDYMDSAVRKLLRSHTEVLVGILEEAAAAGELREGVQPAVVRDLVYGGVEHLAFRVLRRSGTIDADGLADELTDIIMRGVHVAHDAVPQHEETRELQLQIDRLTSIVETLQRKLPQQ